MKKIFILIAFLVSFKTAWAQPSITEVLVPQYIQGAGTFNTADDRKVPYACRLTINGLTPNIKYRYYNRFEVATNASTALGSGYFLLPLESGFLRKISGSFIASTGNFGELTADAAGSYTGWFIME